MRVFVFGTSRSGTTLVRRLLDSHSQLVIAPETHFLPNYWSRLAGFRPIRTQAAYDRFAVALANDPRIMQLGLPRAALIDAVRAERSLRGAFASLLELYRRQHGKAIVGEKTPTHARFVERLGCWFPEARFVNVVRDPRAVAESHTRVAWGRHNAADAALLWLEHVVPVASATRACADRTYTIVYEKLIADPDSELARVCAHLGLDYEPAMLRVRDGLVGATAPFKAMATRELNSDGVDRWRSALDPDAILSVEALTSPWLQRFGYEPTTPLSRRILRLVELQARLARRLPFLATNLLHRELIRARLGDVDGEVGVGRGPRLGVLRRRRSGDVARSVDSRV